MLVIQRGLNESFVVRDQTGKRVCRVIFVEFCGGGKIRLGVDADREIEINRTSVDMEKHPEDYRPTGGKL